MGGRRRPSDTAAGASFRAMLASVAVRARIAELLGLRDGESAKTGRLFAFIFLMTASLVLARSAQRGIFLAAYPRSAIPDAFLLSAAVLAVASFGASALAARVALRRLVQVLLVGGAVLLAVMWLAVRRG